MATRTPHQLIAFEQQLADAEQQVFTLETQSQRQVYQDRIAELKQKLAAFPAGEMVFAIASDFTGEGQFQPIKGRLRPVHLLHRGDLRNPGEAMQRVLRCFGIVRARILALHMNGVNQPRIAPRAKVLRELTWLAT